MSILTVDGKAVAINGSVLRVAANPSGGGTDISLGITGAAAGNLIQVKTVDEVGTPTAWETASAPAYTLIKNADGSLSLQWGE